MRTQSRAFVRLLAVGGIAISAVVLAGCTSTVAARVTSFQQWPADVVGQSYQFVPARPEQINNLEYGAYQDMVRAAAGSTGLVEAGPNTPARFQLSFDYGVEQTQVNRRQPYNPQFYGGFGSYGGYGGFGYGRGFGGPWGWGNAWGPDWVDVPVVAYRQWLNLRINDKQKGNAEVYRSTASSLTDRPDLVQVMPYLVRSIFDNFPGNNGSERTIEYETR